MIGRRIEDTFVAGGVSSVIAVQFLGLSGLVVADAGDQMFREPKNPKKKIIM